MSFFGGGELGTSEVMLREKEVWILIGTGDWGL
jgi:hypothetical protein